MKISYNWLQKYFDGKLPEPEKLAELITFGFSEVEGIEKAGNDMVLDLKILPDRACYALSHRGVAYEIGALAAVEMKDAEPQATPEETALPALSIEIKDEELCRRYMGRRIEKVRVTESPAWLRESLEAVGARSINSIVDATNYVMLDTGQPLHAFDADKVKGAITVRKANPGEKMTTLDGKEVALRETMLVIADEEGPLAIAGIKGGKRAEVTPETGNLIIESANFDPASVRKTSASIGIRNESSKRFENNPSPELAARGMMSVTALIAGLSPGALARGVVDVYPAPAKPHRISVNPDFISRMLGVAVPTPAIIDILERLRIAVEEKGDALSLTVPSFRRDLSIPEDIVEEVGRLYGYEKIKGILPKNTAFKPAVNKNFFYAEKIKNILVERGFSEVYLYTLVDKGDIEVAKPLASDKKALRTNLRDGIARALEHNALSAPLLGLSDVRIFEIGRVFPKQGETLHLAVGVKNSVKSKEKEDAKVEKAIRAIDPHLKVEVKNGIAEINFADYAEKQPDPASYADLGFAPAAKIAYRRFSPYPFIVRDIALFVPADAKPEDVAEVIKKEGTDLMIKGPTLFDDFTKDGRRSLALRMIFQSMERTLSDAEVNTIMERIYAGAKERGWEVR